MGNDAYRFSLHGASLMMKPETAACLQQEGRTLIECILNTSKTIIEMSLAGLPLEIAQRFILKFPKNFGWNFSHKVENPQYYFDFVKKVARQAIYKGNSASTFWIKD
jgi:hypothetical protein